MNSAVRVSLVTLITYVLCFQVTPPINSQDHSSSLLVSPDWLEKQMASGARLRIIDLPLRKTNYDTGHIPGAVFLDWRRDIISSENQHLYQLPSQEEMEQLLSRIGVTPEMTIVVTDDIANRSAVRMYYTLKYFGHKDIRILNGGTPLWKQAKKELTNEVPDIKASQYKITQVNIEYVAKLEAVQNAIDDAGCQLIDGRPEGQFAGTVPGKGFHTNKEHSRRGHVPTADSIPWSQNLNNDGTFKSINELKALYKSRGIDTDGELITYCNEGLHATMPWFVIKELFGNPKVTVYDNSMVEWANRDDTPLELGEHRPD